MIHPFIGYEDQAEWKARMGGSTISAGLTSYGYDARLAADVKIVEQYETIEGVVDPKDFDTNLLRPLQADPVTRAVTLPPHSFALAHTIETFKIPRNVLVVCVGKSTYARCGLIVNVTPLEPEWEGQVTLEISNTTDVPARVYVQEGICQMLFHPSDDVEYVYTKLHGVNVSSRHPVTAESNNCERSYADKGGRYQHQEGIVTPTAEQTAQEV